MHRLAGGRILVFPTASAEPKAVGEESAAGLPRPRLRGRGRAADRARTRRRMAHDPGAHRQGRRASAASISPAATRRRSSRRWRPAAWRRRCSAAIRAAQAAGGLVAGSSAGAAMMSQPMILGGTSIESVVHGVTDDPKRPGLLMGTGLGFFPLRACVDQHFIKRGRLGRLVVAMAEAGVRRGFGIDENTALLVEGGAGAGLRRVRRDGGRHGPGERRRGGPQLPRLPPQLPRRRRRHRARGRFRPQPGAAKRRVRKREIAYRAPTRSRRNVFGAYTLYDLMARLVLARPGGLRHATAPRPSTPAPASTSPSRSSASRAARAG